MDTAFFILYNLDTWLFLHKLYDFTDKEYFYRLFTEDFLQKHY